MIQHSDKDELYKKLLNAPYQLIAIMSIILIIGVSIALHSLYTIGLDEQKNRLVEFVQSQAIMINKQVKHEMHDHQASKSDITHEVLKTITSAHHEFQGFGKTGEFTLAKLENDNIFFLLRHRYTGTENTQIISLKNSKYAEPMRRALRGETGYIIGLDYHGATVLAAYTPIDILGWGIVAKIDLDEIKAPYIEEAQYGIIGILSLIIIGSFFIVRFIKPLIDEIENSRQYNKRLFNESPIGLALTDMDGQIVNANPVFTKLIGYSYEETLKLSYWNITPNKYTKQEQEQLEKIYKDGEYGPYEKEYIHKDGHLIDVRLSGNLIKINGENFIWSSIEDITQEAKNKKELIEAALVFENTHEGIMITDENIKVTRVNSTFTQITGYQPDEIIGENPKVLQSGSHSSDFYKLMWNTIHTKGIWVGELNNRRKNGEYFTSMQSISVVKSGDGRVNGYVSVFSDISKQKNYEKKLSYIATHDRLTSLPNRMYFHDNLTQAINVAKRNKYKIGVLFLDLNKFKAVNDVYGHEVGDKLLVEVAKRLKESVREEDIVARLGGDEFTIILTELKCIKDINMIAEKIVQKIAEPYKIDDIVLESSTSIGISFYPEHGDNVDSLLKLADKAMYSAKQKGGGRYEIYGGEKDYEIL